ncbi:GntR family transcriptional regulator [Xanthomonas phaseoli pv. dieffenbachiae]|uniref:GntR family transcriptional regulator n=1 Tax=Xanthomonas TaxID=338 RepID=UPI001ADBF3FC|nr:MULTISPECIES: GntR family transcriptional regulator [Xanthomonas]MBO9898871.1 GntR family transcriptional regulator [Xanthomonas phaseoli pv. dieffenbachiae]MCC8612765.1 GntR family transcriptional regulator [Xanthomonas euvesicatoria pv. euvesicatoria]
MLRLQISEASHTPKATQVVNGIKAAVFAGQLKAGDRLPSVRDAAELWKVPKDIVARAYKTLLKENVVQDTDDRGPLPRYIVSETVHIPAQAEREQKMDGLVTAMVAQARKLGFSVEEIESASVRVLAKLIASKRKKKAAV